MSDLWYAVRSLRGRPLFAVTAILILGIGIGATTAVFSVVDGLLLEPLPYPKPDRLVRIWKNFVARDLSNYPLTYPEYERWRSASETLDDAATMWWKGAFDSILSIDERPRHVRTLAVSWNYFDVLGVPALFGRTFDGSDDDGGDAPALVLSHHLWQSAFGSDPSVIGRNVRLIESSRDTFRVVGVLPPGVDYPLDVDAYHVGISVHPDWRENRRWEANLVARLAPGVSLDDVRSELTTIATRMTEEDPDAYPEMPVVVTPLLDTVVGDVSRALWFLLGAVSLVLAVAAANVASLLLVRGAEREREIAIRTALGAGRGRLVRQLAVETLVLAVAGGALGLAIAHWGLRVLLLLRPTALPRTEEIALDPRVLAFAFLATVAAALGAGLFPALRASKQDAMTSLRRGRGVLADWRAMSALVVAELAVAFVLVVGAGLLGKTLAAQLRIDRGFASEELTIVTLQIPRTKYSGQSLIDFTDRLIERAEALPGVTGATPVMARPGQQPGGIVGAFRIEGQTDEEAARNPMGNIEIVHENYFRTMGIPLLEGRTFTSSDRGNASKVAVVSKSFAEHHWPGTDALGKRIGGGGMPLLTVVGITADVRYLELDKPWLDIYFPVGQNSFSDEDTPGFFSPGHLLIRSRFEASALAPLLRGVVRELDPDVPIDRVAQIDSILDTEIARPRFHAVMLGLFAAVALGLAAVGLYGVMATVVGARAPEIGIRMALGSTPARAVRTIWKRGVLIALVGIASGVVAGIAATRLLTSFLYGVSPLDAGSFVGAAVFLAMTALCAAYVPARRAARVDPAITLRHE